MGGPPRLPQGSGGSGSTSPTSPSPAEMESIPIIFEEVLAYIISLMNQLQQWVVTMINSLVQGIATMITNVTTWLTGLFARIGTLIEQTITYLRNLMDGILQNIKTFFLAIWEVVRDATVGVLDAIYEWIADAASRLAAFIGDLVDAVVNWIEGVVDFISDLVHGALENIAALVEAIIEAVSSWFEIIEQTAAALIDSVISTITATYEKIFEGVSAVVATIQQRIADLARAFRDSFQLLSEGLEEVKDETLKPLARAIDEYVKPFLATMTDQEIARMFTAARVFTSPNTLVLNDRGDAQAFWDLLMPTNRLGKVLFLAIFNVWSAVTIYQGIGAANAQRILQEYGRRAPYQVLSPADAAAFWRRGIGTQQTAIDAITAAGYTQNDAQKFLAATALVPATGDLFQLFFRGLINEQTLLLALKEQGFDQPWAGAMVQASQIIPPVADLITMAVRDVFSPQTAQRFGLFEDFPPEFAKWAKQHGLSDLWARNYWGAHWQLPSITMGFEMLHRDVIRGDDLNLLLKAHDVMPFWRDKLVKLSYSPYTRVDIRRMHAVGVLSEAGVHRAYLDLGYDEDKAQNLTAFTIRLNQGAPADDELELGKLTRSNILGFYRDGVINRQQAFNLLVGVGATADAANLFLDSEDFDRERDERKVQVELIVEQAEAGLLTFERAADELRKLNLTEVELERALTTLLRAQQRKTRLPTRAEGETLFKAGIINEADFRDLLGRLGYATKWAAAFIQAAKAKG